MGADVGEPMELGKLHPAFRNKFQHIILEEQARIKAEEEIQKRME